MVVQYHAPCVLPWVWDAARPAGSGALQSQPIPLRAGAEGGLWVLAATNVPMTKACWPGNPSMPLELDDELLGVACGAFRGI